MTQVRESLRPLWAIVFVAGLISTAHASLIPSGAEVYFSIDKPTLSISGNGFKILRPGGALSTDGKVGISNWDLVKNFKPEGGKQTDVGLDGLQVFRWASGHGRLQVFFSTDSEFYSQSLKTQITPGEVLNKQGQIVATNQQLVAAFQPGSAADFGLEAFDVLDPGLNHQIWFSTTTGFHSDKLGRDINPGDVLSNSGQVIATNADLLKAFAPKDSGTSYGLDALYVVNEKGQTPVIWFSTSKSFYSNALEQMVSEGALLNNQGQIVATNAELMGRFGLRLPLDSGLDGFSMVRTMDSDFSHRGGGRDIPPPATPEPVSIALLALTIPMILRRKAA